MKIKTTPSSHLHSLVIKIKNKKERRWRSSREVIDWTITSRRVCMFIRQRRITVAPFQSFLFLFICLYTVSISSVYFIRTCFLKDLFSFSLSFVLFPLTRSHFSTFFSQTNRRRRRSETGAARTSRTWPRYGILNSLVLF